MSQGPFPLGTFPPGSYSAQQQRLYENLPKPLKEAYRKEAIGQGPMSSDEKNAYDHLAKIFSHLEETNTWIEMIMESRPGKKRDENLEVFRAQLADEMKEWEDYAKEPLKVLGSVSLSTDGTSARTDGTLRSCLPQVCGPMSATVPSSHPAKQKSTRPCCSRPQDAFW